MTTNLNPVWWEVYIKGMGKEVMIEPVGDTWRKEGATFVKQAEASRRVRTVPPLDTLELNFFSTTGPEDLSEEQTLYYGKYAIRDLASGKVIYVDFRDADYPYSDENTTMNIVAQWEALEEGKVCEIWKWSKNNKVPNQTPFVS